MDSGHKTALCGLFIIGLFITICVCAYYWKEKSFYDSNYEERLVPSTVTTTYQKIIVKRDSPVEGTK